MLIRSAASDHSVGGVLIQDGTPVDFCSAALRQAEKNYAVIEKELLAILISCERFEHYIIHHQDVTVETDHRPLMNIFKKPLYDALRDYSVCCYVCKSSVSEFRTSAERTTPWLTG